MTLQEAAALKANTDGFDAAVEAASDACEAGDKSAGPVLLLLLQKNNDFCMTGRA